MTVERPEPPQTGDERESLRGHLDFHRATLAVKCAGLSEEQLRQAAAPPSTLSLLGLVRHLAEVERSWFRRVLDGQDVPLVWSATGDFQAAYDVTGAERDEAFDAWQAEIAHARRIEAAFESLDAVAYLAKEDLRVSLRHVLLHLIQEYARHNGHADLIRQALDGTTGV